MWLLYTLLAAVGLLLLLILPGRHRNTAPFHNTRYAHRGLHSGNDEVPENSLAAFEAAVQAGYGVELDIQFTADRQIVVFHDSDLKRMCGANHRVDELTYDELQNYTLLGSNQRIPLLGDVLDVLNGATLLCELKPMRSYTDTTLCEAALPLLDAYKGAVCVESFNPLMIRWFRKRAPGYIRGILSKRFEKGEVAPVLRFPLTSLFTNALCRPDFIAYQYTDHNQFFFRVCKLFRPMTIAWTVPSAAEENKALKHFDTVIFEGYLSKKNEQKTFL